MKLINKYIRASYSLYSYILENKYTNGEHKIISGDVEAIQMLVKV